MKKKFIIPAVLLLIFSGCGEATNTDHVHDLSYHSKVNATCTENGHEAYFECLECHKLFSDEMAENEIASPAETIATGHGDNLHHFDAGPGTCLDVGVKEFYECYSCDRIYSDAEGKNQIEAPESSGIFLKTESSSQWRSINIITAKWSIYCLSVMLFACI